MRWPEVEHGPRRLLVVQVGSLEQHGPHLPLDTDTRIAVAVARRACAGRAGIALAPEFSVGASGEHADFPGTLSIGTEALSICLIELGPTPACTGQRCCWSTSTAATPPPSRRHSADLATRPGPPTPGTPGCPQ